MRLPDCSLRKSLNTEQIGIYSSSQVLGPLKLDSLFRMSFGWSAGDIVAGLNTLAKVGKALEDSGRAATEYQEAVTYSSSVSKTLSRIQTLLQNNPNLLWEADLVQQGNILKSAIGDFVKKINKYDKSIGVDTQRQKARRVPREDQFALFCSDQVKELRTAITQPQLVLDLFISLQTLWVVSRIRQYYC
jgi:hypothetical protein